MRGVGVSASFIDYCLVAQTACRHVTDTRHGDFFALQCFVPNGVSCMTGDCVSVVSKGHAIHQGTVCNTTSRMRVYLLVDSITATVRVVLRRLNKKDTSAVAELFKLQAYHCGLLRLLFLSNNENDGKFVTVSMAVVSNKVKLSITAKRLVRCIGGEKMDNSIHKLLDVIMEDYWNFEGRKGKAGSGGRHAEGAVRFPLLSQQLS
jgi:hypothetical protein